MNNKDRNKPENSPLMNVKENSLLLNAKENVQSMNAKKNVQSVNAKEKVTEQVLSETSFWKELSPQEKTVITNQSSVKQFARNQLINSSDSACMGMVFVLKGGIRVSLLSEEGREITLYRLSTGDCCVTTASCVIRQITFDTFVTASDDSSLFVIPSAIVAILMKSNVYFRAFVYETETERFSQAIWVMQELLFKRFDQRLASFLISEYEATGNTDLKLTQEEIARDVNSAREVVARMLGHFSAEGLVAVKRGHIILKDIDGLKEIC